MKKTLLIDMDDTLVDFLGSLLSIYNKETKENVKEEDIVSYGFEDCVKQKELIFEIFNRPGFFENLKPMPLAVKYFKKLNNSDMFDVVIVTQPPRKSQTAFAEKRNWIKNYIPDFDLSGMIFAHKKHLIAGDIFFDDNPSHLLKWRSSHINGKTCKIWKAYNKDCKTDFSFSKETAWRTFYKVMVSL